VHQRARANTCASDAPGQSRVDVRTMSLISRRREKKYQRQGTESNNASVTLIASHLTGFMTGALLLGNR